MYAVKCQQTKVHILHGLVNVMRLSNPHILRGAGTAKTMKQLAVNIVFILVCACAVRGNSFLCQTRRLLRYDE